MDSRRKSLMTFIRLGVPAGILALAHSAQARPKRPQNPPQLPQQKEDDSNTPKPDPKLILEANQNELKKNVERLYDLASELKAEAENTDTGPLFSLPLPI